MTQFKGLTGITRLNTPHVDVRRSILRAALAMRLAFLTLGSLLLVQEAAAMPTAPSRIRFRSPGSFSIVVPVYLNGSGPFEFLLDTGSTLTIVDPELLQLLRLDVIGDGTNTSLTGKTTMPLAVARTVSVGPVTESNVELGVRDLAGMRELDSRIRGVLGQNVLSNTDYLIDNRKQTIEFDPDGALLDALDGEHVNTKQILTPGNPIHGGTAVRIRLGRSGKDYCFFLLDSGSASVVLFSDSPDVARMPKQSSSQVVEDEIGRRKYVSAFPMQLGVGSTHRDVQVYVASINSAGLEVEGLLPTAVFDSLYISNSRGFVILQPKRNRLSPVVSKDGGVLPFCETPNASRIGPR